MSDHGTIGGYPKIASVISADLDKVGQLPPGAKIKFTKIQLGDVPKTHSSTKKIQSWIGFKPKTKIKFGIKKFVEWYVQYYKIKNIK